MIKDQGNGMMMMMMMMLLLLLLLLLHFGPYKAYQQVKLGYGCKHLIFFTCQSSMCMLPHITQCK